MKPYTLHLNQGRYECLSPYGWHFLGFERMQAVAALAEIIAAHARHR